MRIVTYSCDDEDWTLAGCEAIARLLIPGRDAKGKPAEVWHPVIIHGSTMADARMKAQVWWDGELAKEQQRQANARAAGERISLARKAKAEGQS